MCLIVCGRMGVCRRWNGGKRADDSIQGDSERSVTRWEW